jgi:hypothetical protein
LHLTFFSSLLLQLVLLHYNAADVSPLNHGTIKRKKHKNWSK